MPACLFLGYNSAQHSVGTVTTNWTLTDADTDVNVNGEVTVTPPVTPSDNQAINITNTGTVTVDGVTTIPPGGETVIYWGGASWGWAARDCTDGALPATADQGTSVVSGPAEIPYDVPQTTVVIRDLLELPCGTSVIEKVTKTYSSRGVANAYKLADGATLQALVVPGGGYYNRPTVGLGVTLIDAYNNLFASAGYLTSGEGYTYDSTSIVPYDGNGFSPEPPIGTNCLKGNVIRDSTGGVVVMNSNLAVPVLVTGTATRPTIYYLDVHEVWTYEAI